MKRLSAMHWTKRNSDESMDDRMSFIDKIPQNRFDKDKKCYCITFCLAVWFAIIYLIIVSSSIKSNGDRYHRFSLNLADVESIFIESDSELPRAHNENCSFWDCFNVYRCGEKLSIYVYPLIDYVGANENADEANTANVKEFMSTLSVLSREFYEILKIIIESRYYTSDPKAACILVPSIDTLNLNRLSSSFVAKALARLPYWENGENHLLFNVVPNAKTVTDLHSDRAMIAGSDFDSWTYRTGFDFVIPFLGFNKTNFRKNLNLDEVKRPNWLIASVIKLTDNQRTELLDVASKSDQSILILDKCPASVMKRSTSSVDMRCSHGTTTTYDYKTAFSQSVFCLVAKTERFFQINFIEALAANCIPVIYADNVVLPFIEIIDWSLATTTIPETDLHSIEAKLKSISVEKIAELRHHGRMFFDNYFSSNKRIVETVLAELEDRIFPYKGSSYFDWNSRPAYENRQNPLFLSRIAPKSQGFTAVILTYDRIESLFKLIQKLSVVSTLQKILVIWNNEKQGPPHMSTFPKITKSLKVIRTTANKLSNRFYPYDEIETEAILTIDDDIVMLTADELDFGFEVWREFPDRIVGFPSRTHVWENDTMRWRYESEWTNQISMVLTGAAFHHKYWSYAYTNQLPAEIRQWVDDHMNCEDIAMNFLVANVTKKPPIKVVPRKKFKCPECTNTEMLSADMNHMIERSKCINRFSKIYGTMPLKTVEFRADPVLFKDNFPEKLKRFNDVGSL